MKEHPIFNGLSIEALIKDHQTEYYECLSRCDHAGASTEFIEFSLTHIENALLAYSRMQNIGAMDTETRLAYAKEKLHSTWFSRKMYIGLHSDISTSTASRDLEKGLMLGVLRKQGNQRLTQYQYI
jgi:Fic family protein